MTVRAVSLALAVALLTWLAGWWAVLVVALAAGWLWRAARGRAGTVALGAALGWGALLAMDALSPRFAALGAVLGGVLPLPAIALAIVTLAFAALMGWSGAVIGSALGRLTTR
jgi:hypothetical protein